VKAADDRGDRFLAGQLLCVGHSVDDAGVSAPAQDQQALIRNADYERVIVEDQRVVLQALPRSA
jgi:hypothetical protein